MILLNLALFSAVVVYVVGVSLPLCLLELLVLRLDQLLLGLLRADVIIGVGPATVLVNWLLQICYRNWLAECLAKWWLAREWLGEG